MRPQLVSFDGRRWVDGSEEAGELFRVPGVGRSAAYADYDRDGDTDVQLVRQNAKAVLLKNVSAVTPKLRFRLIGRKAARTAFGTRLTLFPDSPDRTSDVLFCGESFASAHETAVEFTLGDPTVPVPVLVQWPSGVRQHFQVPAGATRVTVIEERAPMIAVPRS